MQARCPHCHTVFSTAASGVQACPSCGRRVNVPELAVNPSAPLDPFAAPPPGPPPGQRGPTPWEQRAELGAARGILETLKRSTLRPGRFWSATRPDASVLDALLWAWIVVAIGAVIQLPFALAEFGPTVESLDELVRGFEAQGQVRFASAIRTLRGQLVALGPAGYALAQVVPRALFFPLFALVFAALLHLFCMLFGCSKNGFTATFRAVCYASGPMLLVGVTVVGIFMFSWMVILIIWGLRELHETNEIRASLAVLGAPLLLCCCIGCGLGVALARPGGSPGGQAPPAKTIELGHSPVDSPR